jgi:hypothetical protein
MAINPSLPLFAQQAAPGPAARASRLAQVSQPDFHLPMPSASVPQNFEQATRQFGESIQALSPADRKEIQILHSAVDQWADANPGVDRLGPFCVKVMQYSDKRLQQLESAPGTGVPGECEGLEKAFKTGYNMVVLYSSLVQN